MNWSSIKDAAAKAAPFLGTIVGGPAGPAIGAMIASALDTEASPQAVMDALQSPEKQADLRKWAYDHRERLEEIALDTLKTELADTQHAREQHKHSRMPAVICLMLICVTTAFAAALFFIPIPEANQSTAYMLLGQLLGWTGAAIAYWVGTTRSSAEKSKGAMR